MDKENKNEENNKDQISAYINFIIIISNEKIVKLI